MSFAVRPSPARISEAAAVALPRPLLFALLIVYIVAGLFGRDGCLKALLGFAEGKEPIGGVGPHQSEDQADQDEITSHAPLSMVLTWPIRASPASAA